MIRVVKRCVLAEQSSQVATGSEIAVQAEETHAQRLATAQTLVVLLADELVVRPQRQL